MTETTVQTVPAFAVQATHPRNCDLHLMCLNGVIGRRMRSTTNPLVTNIQGQPRPFNRQDPVPVIPGQILRVFPSELRVVMEDPFFGDDVMRDALARWLRKNQGGTSTIPPSGIPPVEGRMDANRMKSLCREILHLLADKSMTQVEGPAFDLEDVDGLPGDYLLNPGSIIPTGQPALEKHWDQYVQRCNQEHYTG